MDKTTSSSRAFAKWIFVPLEYLLVAVVNGAVVIHLANMQLDGLPTLIGVILALMAATTSLLFNRARAYPAGAVQRRTLLSAELFLRATLLAMVGSMVVFSVFFPLKLFGYEPVPIDRFSNYSIPFALSLIPMQFYLGSSFFLMKAGRLIFSTLLARFNARDILKASK